MPAHLDLIITADHPNGTADFRLLDSSGVQLAFRQSDFKAITVSHQQGLFDTSPGQPTLGERNLLVRVVHDMHAPASEPFYEQAATQALAVAEAGGERFRQAWADLAVTTGNWANGLGDVGDLDAARQRQLEAAEAHKKAGDRAIEVVGRELEALRIDIEQGKVESALPQVEARLAQVEAWWKQHRSGQPVPEAPDAEFLARALIGALDIAREAHFVQEDWASALRRIDATLEVERALKRPEDDIAATRMNRANVLVELPGHFGEAKAELEDCLQLFQNNPASSAKLLGSLAALFHKQGDVAQAITQQRRALALHEQLPDPDGRAISRNNLANYLEHSGTPAALAESPRQRNLDLAELQAAVDQFLEQARKRAEQAPANA